MKIIFELFNKNNLKVENYTTRLLKWPSGYYVILKLFPITFFEIIKN